MDNYGISQGVKASMEIYLRATRRTGRTTELVSRLQDGDRVVFTNQREADRVYRLCREKGVTIKAMVVNPTKPYNLFNSFLDQRVLLDHSWVEEYYTNAIEIAEKDLGFIERNTRLDKKEE